MPEVPEIRQEIAAPLRTAGMLIAIVIASLFFLVPWLLGWAWAFGLI